jgi:hypothetical protein
VARLLDDQEARAAQVADTQAALREIGLGTLSPSRRAAEEVLAVIARRGAPPGRAVR